MEHLLDRGGAVVDVVEREDLADAHGELALRARAIAARQSVDLDVADAVVEDRART